MKESTFQKQFIEFLTMLKIVRVNEYDENIHKGWFFAVINNEYASFKEQKHIILHNFYLGRCKGVSDLIIFHNKLMFCELKVNRNKQTYSQKIFQKAVESSGFEYKIIRRLEDFYQ